MPPTPASDPPALAGLRRIHLAWTYLKLTAWALFLLVMPAMCLQRGLVGAAILCGALGLLLDLAAIDLLLAWARGWAPALRRLLLLYHLGVGVLAGFWLLQPLDPRWTLLPGTDDLANPAVAAGPDGLLVLGGGDLRRFVRDEAPRSLAYPGPFAWISHATGDGAVWVVPRDEPQIYRLADDRWEALPRPPGQVQALAGATRLWLLVAHELHTRAPGDVRWDRSAACPGPTSVAVAPDDDERVLVVGRAWCLSRDGGRTWRERTPPAAEFAAFPAATLGAGGWQYVSSSATFRATLHTRGPDELDFTARTPPASDIRAIVTDPRDGRRAFAGTWGEGVFMTDDGGATWSDFGLQKIQVRTLAIDPVARTLAVASSNTIFDLGVYLRPIAG